MEKTQTGVAYAACIEVGQTTMESRAHAPASIPLTPFLAFRSTSDVHWRWRKEVHVHALCSKLFISKIRSAAPANRSRWNEFFPVTLSDIDSRSFQFSPRLIWCEGAGPNDSVICQICSRVYMFTELWGTAGVQSPSQISQISTPTNASATFIAQNRNTCKMS